MLWFGKQAAQQMAQRCGPCVTLSKGDLLCWFRVGWLRKYARICMAQLKHPHNINITTFPMNVERKWEREQRTWFSIQLHMFCLSLKTLSVGVCFVGACWDYVYIYIYIYIYIHTYARNWEPIILMFDVSWVFLSVQAKTWIINK